MFEPFLLKLGPLGVAVVFVVVVMGALAPGVWDVAARLAATPTVERGALARLRATARAAADAWRARASATEIGSLLWAAMARVR